MSVLVIGSIFIGVGSLVFYFTGWFRICLNILFSLAYGHHKSMRRAQRPSRIFLIRHGESQANVNKDLYIKMACSKIELTERGHQQAVAAGEKLRSIIGNGSMYVYMSPYIRAKQTWANIRKAFSPSQIITERQDPRIREQELGNTADPYNRTQYLKERDRVGHFFYRYSSGESGADVYDRVSLFLDTLFREMDNGKHNPTQNIVIVSHGLFMRLFLMRYFRWDVEDLDNIKPFENCAICQLTKVNGIYTLDGTTKPPCKVSEERGSMFEFLNLST